MAFPLGAALAAFLVAAPAQAADQHAAGAQVQSVPVIAPAALKAMMAGGQRFLLVDVREPGEFSTGHIEGAKLVPLGSLEAEYAQFPKDVTIVVYCRSGHRSAQAVAFLKAHGYGRAVSLDGGFLAWSAQPR